MAAQLQHGGGADGLLGGPALRVVLDGGNVGMDETHSKPREVPYFEAMNVDLLLGLCLIPIWPHVFTMFTASFRRHGKRTEKRMEKDGTGWKRMEKDEEPSLFRNHRSWGFQ